MGVSPQRGSGTGLYATIFCKRQAKGFALQSLTHVTMKINQELKMNRVKDQAKILLRSLSGVKDWSERYCLKKQIFFVKFALKKAVDLNSLAYLV